MGAFGCFCNLILSISFLFSSLNYTKKMYFLGTFKSRIYGYIKLYWKFDGISGIIEYKEKKKINISN